MGNLISRCSECKSEITMSKEQQSSICTHCKENIELKELIPSNNEEVNKAEREIVHKLIEQFSDVLVKHIDEMKGFKKKQYEDSFFCYKNQYNSLLEQMNVVYLDFGEEGESFLKHAATNLVKETIKASKRYQNKNREKRPYESNKNFSPLLALGEYKMVFLVYTIPMIREFKLPISEPLTDYLLSEWIQANPKDSKIKKGLFEELNAGFKRGNFCYITTAVCESLGKSDCCYELEQFRNFRDGFLIKEEDGFELIQQYYDIAPYLLMKIKTGRNEQQVLKYLWETYLCKCLIAIEEGKLKKCKMIYCCMVTTLKKQYLV